MSTLEKTINLLNDLPENEVEIIYSYVRFISSQHEERKKATEPIEDIFNNIVGVLPDTGKTAKQYHDERIAEKYDLVPSVASDRHRVEQPFANYGGYSFYKEMLVRLENRQRED